MNGDRGKMSGASDIYLSDIRSSDARKGIGMTGFGYKQTSSRPKSTSALPPKADILVAITDFRL